MKGSSVLDHMRAICLALPDTKETLTWGQPHFRVGEKIFAGCGEEKGRVVIGFKLDMDHADAVIQDPRFWRAPYVGHKGWVSMDAGGVDDWDEVRPLVMESYRLIAPRRTVAKLDAGEAPPASPRRSRPRPAVRKAKRRPRGGLLAPKKSAKKVAKRAAKSSRAPRP
jgi:predicted DNA-binding protein (MmcQ/YjbR family)